MSLSRRKGRVDGGRSGRELRELLFPAVFE